METEWALAVWVVDGIMHTATLIGSLWYLNRSHVRAEARIIAQNVTLNEVLSEVGQILGETRSK